MVENTESFRAQLSSSDDFVQFELQSTDVLIQDDDSMISISLGPSCACSFSVCTTDVLIKDNDSM